MTAKFLHTADWQIGKPFAGIADTTKRVLVQQERLRVIERIGQAAHDHGARFILVAGDLFDSPSPTNDTVAAACAAIGALGLPVLAIPGNHDHGGAGGVWEQPFFRAQRDARAPNLRPMLEAAPVELDDAVVFPCPLLRRHEPDDTTAWLQDASDGFPGFGGKPRIVLAHGSVHGFATESDEDEVGAARVNRIELERLPADQFDYIALGDWHGMKQVAGKAWYAGTPEPDRFPRGEDNRPGHVLVVTATRGAAPVVSAVATGRLNWLAHSFTFAGDDSIAVLENELDEMLGQRAQQDLLVLELTGSLGIAASNRLQGLLEGWRAGLLRLKLADRTGIAPTAGEIDALTRRQADPVIASVAARLVADAQAGGEQGEIARLALRELHAACQEC